MNKKPHIITVVVFDNVVLADFALPCEVFSRVQKHDGQHPYIVKVCGVSKFSSSTLCGITATHSLRALDTADTIIVPGATNHEKPTCKTLLRALSRANDRGARVASVCTGAFILAEAGLLNGMTVTTHWLAAKELANCYPEINVDPDVLFVDNGNILTSAGAAAGLDLCLYMVQKDFGVAVAADAARMNVMPLIRSGGQAQFIKRKPQNIQHGTLQPLLDSISENLNTDLSVSALANFAAMSVRTLHRKFEQQTGMTPANWVLLARIQHAQQLLETCDHSVEAVAAQSGFGSSSTFRERFKTIVGASPVDYRSSFRVLANNSSA